LVGVKLDEDDVSDAETCGKNRRQYFYM